MTPVEKAALDWANAHRDKRATWMQVHEAGQRLMAAVVAWAVPTAPTAPTEPHEPERAEVDIAPPTAGEM